jgi:hypothetical protein
MTAAKVPGISGEKNHLRKEKGKKNNKNTRAFGSGTEDAPAHTIH